MWQSLLSKLQDLNARCASFLGEGSPEAAALDPSLKNVLYDLNPKMLKDLLPYETFDEETSLFINKNSMGFILELSPLIGSSEEHENILASLITDAMPCHIDLQCILWASPKIGPALNAFSSARSRDELFERLALERIAYLSKGAFESLGDTGSFLLRDFRLFWVGSVAKKLGADTDLLSFREDAVSSLKSIHVQTRILQANDFLNLLSDWLTPSQSIIPSALQWNEHETLSVQAVNLEWSMEIGADFLKFVTSDQQVEARVLTVNEHPEKATQWRMTENLGQLFNTSLQIPCPFLVSFSIRKLEQEKAQMQAQLKFMNRENIAKSPLAKLRPSITQEYEEWKFVRNRLNDGDCLVKTFYEVILFAKPKDMAFCERRVRDLYRANGWKLRRESYLQLQSWLASLPMFFSEGMYEDLKQFGRLKTITAFNAINIAPMQGEWKGTMSPSLLLPGRRGQLAMWDPFDNEGGNYNIAITAAPGKGKSAFTQEYIVAMLGRGGRVWVIDAGRSYEKTCKYLNGQFIEFTQEADICLNPFSSIQDLSEAMVMLKPLLASMARPLTGATEEELSYLEKAIKAAWEERARAATITTVSEWLAKQDNTVCQNLAHILFGYTKDGLYGRFFEGPCTVDFNNRFIVMELQELKAKKDLQRIVLQVLIFLISQQMYESDRHQIKSCVIDESWDLFDDDNRSTAKFIEAGYRTARKFSGNFVSIAHSIADFHRNAMTKAAYDCADFKVILGQTVEAINKLKQDNLMDMDVFTERLFKSLKITADYSECVIQSPEGLSVHRIIFDPYSRILYSTKGEEFDAVNKCMKQGLTLTEAIAHVAQKISHR